MTIAEFGGPSEFLGTNVFMGVTVINNEEVTLFLKIKIIAMLGDWVELEREDCIYPSSKS